MSASPPNGCAPRSPEGTPRERVRTLREAGLALSAVDLARSLLAATPADLDLRVELARALVSAGALAAARAQAEDLVARGHADVEVLGLLARTAKSEADRCADPVERRRWLARALEEYRRAHAASPDDYWAGVNAAGLARVLGEDEEARALAGVVAERCRRALTNPIAAVDRQERYYLEATLGEVCLILGDLVSAQRHYRVARAVPGIGSERHASTLGNARRWTELLGLSEAALDDWFPLPPIVVYAGHMLDRVGRAAPRFPAAQEPRVRAALAALLERTPGAQTYGSAACGADLLMLEEAQRLGMATHVVLPYEREAFRRDCVTYLEAGDLGPRFDGVLARATSVRCVSEQSLPGGTPSIEFANTVIFGTALSQARRLQRRVRGVAVWDGRPGDGQGGTQWIVDELWTLRAVPVTCVDPRSGSSTTTVLAAPGEPRQGIRPVRGAAQDFEPSIRAILFADFHGFSRLREDQLPAFVTEVLGAVGALADEAGAGVLVRNTWGDGLYLVFETPAHAALFALALLRRIERACLQAQMPADFGLRVALHAGPVVRFRDPVTGGTTFGGRHVSFAARLEPRTPVGSAYCTQDFAALIEARGDPNFACEYVGEEEFAKGAGRHPTYVLLGRPAGRTDRR